MNTEIQIEQNSFILTTFLIFSNQAEKNDYVFVTKKDFVH